jgi:subtilase family serine protease
MRSRPGRPRIRSLTAGFASVAAATAFLATAGAAHAAPGIAPVGLAGIVPSGAARIGSVPSTTRIHIDVVLDPANAAGLTQYATQVATPGSALYHRYLKRGQFARLFGASSATIDNVLSGLRALGLHPGAVASDHLSVPVTATAAQISSAFGVTLASYRLHGRTGFSNTDAPRLPASIAASVEDIIGLDNLTTQQSFATAPSKASVKLTRTKSARPAGEPTDGPQPCTDATDEAEDTGAFTADELAFAYEFSDLYMAGDFGKGQTVGIVEFGEPDSPSDIAAYQSCYGTHVPVSYTKVDGFHQTGPGEGEAALDIETVAGMAPGVAIDVYQAPNTGAAPYDIYQDIVDQDKVSVVSESYGLCEHYQDVKAVNAVTVLYEQAAVQGQTIVASSGDSGSEGCLDNDGVKSRLSVNFPASDPLVLGVGGTTLFDLEPRPGEAVWNERAIGAGAGGGGKSTLFSEPGYQSSFGIKASVREVPDVSADADPETGYVYVHGGEFGAIGGTSAAAPLWASLLALINAECPTSPLGWVNPLIYYAASPHVKAVVIDDIPKVSGSLNNNDYTGDGGGHYAVAGGYDMGTGLGSPIAGALATTACSLNAEAKGYWLATANGHVYAENAPFHGSLAGKHLSSPVVAIAADRNTDGYWLVTSKGAVSAFDAPPKGSVKGGSGIVGIASDASGSGYWVVNSSGHVFAFGAPARGSVKNPSGKVVGIATDAGTNGYWVVTSTGHVYAFHAKAFANKKLSGVTGIAASRQKQGYWLTTASGQVHGFGVDSQGNMPANVGKVIGIAGDGGPFGGYWLATSTGHVGAFDADFHGDHPGSGTVGIAGS